jgi:hypothetical protein
MGRRETTARTPSARPHGSSAAVHPHLVRNISAIRMLAAFALAAMAVIGLPCPRAAAFPIEGDEQSPTLPSRDDPSEPEDLL